MLDPDARAKLRANLNDAALLSWHYHWGDGGQRSVYLSYAALVVFVGMTLRYLKFYRHYAVEVFTSYAYANDSFSGASKP